MTGTQGSDRQDSSGRGRIKSTQGSSRAPGLHSLKLLTAHRRWLPSVSLPKSYLNHLLSGQPRSRVPQTQKRRPFPGLHSDLSPCNYDVSLNKAELVFLQGLHKSPQPPLLSMED